MIIVIIHQIIPGAYQMYYFVKVNYTAYLNLVNNGLNSANGRLNSAIPLCYQILKN